VLIGLVSLAERKWGAGISGALVGLPLTSGPVLFILAIEQGASFSARTSIGSLLGLTALAGFAVVYSRVSRSQGWVPSLAAACVVYVAISIVILEVPLRSAGWSFAITCCGLLGVLRAFPPNAPMAAGSKTISGRELIARMITAAALVFLLTGVAHLLGPVPSGLVAMFPVYTGIVTVFNHMKSSARAATALKGVIVGAFGGAVFFVIVAATLEKLAVGVCFLLAALAGIAVPAVLLPYLRPAPGG
jgi:hypothetical protein